MEKVNRQARSTLEGSCLAKGRQTDGKKNKIWKDREERREGEGRLIRGRKVGDRALSKEGDGKGVQSSPRDLRIPAAMAVNISVTFVPVFALVKKMRSMPLERQKALTSSAVTTMFPVSVLFPHTHNTTPGEADRSASVYQHCLRLFQLSG